MRPRGSYGRCHGHEQVHHLLVVERHVIDAEQQLVRRHGVEQPVGKHFIEQQQPVVVLEQQHAAVEQQLVDGRHLVQRYAVRKHLGLDHPEITA